MQIKNRWNEKIICEGDFTLKELAQNNRADLSGANLSGADLSRADLLGADLSGADLSRADLLGADLSRANLSRANLSWANLSGADLSWANLSGADLSWANNIEFYNLPSLRTLSSISFNNLPDNLQLELMRRDAQAHPHPELFDEWVQTNQCPYQNEERFWLFEPKPELWKSGKPEMSDFDLIIALVKSQGWRVRGYL